MNGDWTLEIPGLDPRCAETGPLRDKATGPGIPDEDQGLRKTEGLAESRTSWDSGLREIQDFAGPRTSWDSRLRGT